MVKSIDDKVEAILDELREAIEVKREDYFPDRYWDDNFHNGYY